MTHGLIILDLDGTLLDTRKDLANAVNLTRTQLGLSQLPEETIISYVGDGADKLMARALADCPNYDLEQVRNQFRQNYMDHLMVYATPYPGVYDFLETLKNLGYQFALLSNKPQSASQILMEHFHFSPYLEKIIGGGGDFPMKPDPTAVIYLQELCGVDAAHTWMVGDHYTDLNVARNAAIHSVFVRWGFGETRGEVPEYMCDSFADLTTFFIKFIK